jgi:DNA-binding XRE family transcriptional regulator
MKNEQQNTDWERKVHRLQLRMFRRMLRKDPDAQGLGLRGLRAARVTAGLSQRDLAERIGASQNTICELENQQRGANLKTIRKLSRALRLQPLHLTFFSESVARIRGGHCGCCGARWPT